MSQHNENEIARRGDPGESYCDVILRLVELQTNVKAGLRLRVVKPSSTIVAYRAEGRSHGVRRWKASG